MSTPLPRSEFAVTRDYVYLNHASAGVLPRSSLAAIDEFLRRHAEAGVLGTYPYDERMPEYRERIARFIGARGYEIAMAPNTSAAANVVAAGIDWQPGDEVVLCDNEFPANAIPWIALRRRGVNVRLIDTARRRLTPDVLAEEMTPRTRAVSVSWVSYADGYRHDLRALAAVAHGFGSYLCVDGIQALGVFPVDVADAGVDAFFAGGAKWMLSLHGVALLYLGPRVRERLALAMPGWRSLEDMWDFHNYEQPYSREAMRFEAGTPNLIGTLSLVCAIELLERCGEALAEHVLALTDRLCNGLRDLGANLTSLRGEGISSGIVTFSIPGYDSMELGRTLQNAKIVTTYRPSGLRVSPHGYNTATEIDVLLENLGRLTRAQLLV